MVFVFLFTLTTSVFADCAQSAYTCSSVLPYKCSNSGDTVICCSTANECPATIPDLDVIFKNVVGVILALAGLVLFIMLIIGGFRFITSNGDPKAVDSAKKTLTSAIVGLIVLLFAYVILTVISKLTGVDITSFSVTLPQ